MIDKVITKTNCTGCKLCKDVCPVGAISFEINNEGFWYPTVDENKCINCNICINRCPILQEDFYKKEIRSVYSAWIKDDKIRFKSTSGGIFYALADYILSNGGYIVGSQYADDFKSAFHTFSNTYDGLQHIMGSKYFQSDTDGIYKKTKELVLKRKPVLFCGTPCQSAALQSFFTEIPDNLYIVDFVCRGVNSPLAFKKHIEELERDYKSPVEYVHLKNKKTGWQSIATYIRFKNGKEYHEDLNSSLWVRGFIAGGNLFSRECCYRCAYKKMPRISDITIGDFWGIENASSEDMFKGISMFMLSSKKGQFLFECIKDKIEYKEERIELALDGNPAFSLSAIRHENREMFFELLKEHDFSYAVQKCTAFRKKSKVRKLFSKPLRLINKVHFLLSIDTVKFIKFNFFSKNIIRDNNCYIIPYKNAVIDLSKESRIHIKGQNIEFGVNKFKGSKSETSLRMRGNAIWKSNNGCQLCHGTTIDINNNALFETGFFYMNSQSVIICSNHIRFGEDILLGRNNIILDNDHHKVFDANCNINNYSREVIIDDHVWLTTHVTVLKGVTIGGNCIITAKTLVRKDIPENSIVAGESDGKVVSKCTGWSRKAV